MSISVKQNLLLTLYGDGSSTTATFDLSSPPFTNPSLGTEFSIGSPNGVIVTGLDGPIIVGEPPIWERNRAYPLSFVIGEQKPYQLQVNTTGTSDSTDPFTVTSPTVGDHIVDGTVNWTVISPFPVDIHDTPSVIATVHNHSVTLIFSTAPKLFGSTIVDNYGNSLIIGTYTINLTFVYNG